VTRSMQENVAAYCPVLHYKHQFQFIICIDIFCIKSTQSKTHGHHFTHTVDHEN